MSDSTNKLEIEGIRLEQEAARVNWRAAPTPTPEVRRAGANG